MWFLAKKGSNLTIGRLLHFIQVIVYTNSHRNRVYQYTHQTDWIENWNIHELVKQPLIPGGFQQLHGPLFSVCSMV